MTSDFAKIIVATHKKYEMPHDELYLPVRVGAALARNNFGFQGDDKGDNISGKNPYYCELTGLYWAWKNCDAKYIGLVHYRRYFGLKKTRAKSPAKRLKRVLTSTQLKVLLAKNDIILPKKRNYLIEDLYSHYEHTMHVEPLDKVRQIIMEKYPEYYAEMRKLEKRKTAHMFNMFIMRKEILDDYCKWLFNVLGELEKVSNPENYSAFHARYFGRISELLLDVYIRTKGLKYAELPVIDVEGINWIKKGSSFIKAKVTGKKYEESF